MQHDFYPGDRVKWSRRIKQTAEGIVTERGVKDRKYYVIVAFNKPMEFKKKFEGDDIKQIRRA